MEAIKTTIPGLVVFKLGVFRDNRGWFKENFNHAKVISAAREVLDEGEQGLKVLEEFSIVQNNISYSSSEVIRGMHAEPWEKFISIASGKVYGAWVDLREGPSFGNVFQMELTPETAIFVPRGVANGFQALEDTSYAYLVNDYWSLELKPQYRFVNFNDPELGINWPLGINWSLVSEDDKNHPMLSDVKGI